MDSALLGALAGLVGLAGYMPYIISTARRRTKPDRPAWLVWSASYCVLLVGQAGAGGRASLALAAASLIGSVATFGLALRYGKGGMDAWSVLLCVGVAMAVAAWWWSGDAGVAVWVALGAEAAGMGRTIAGAYREPGSESALAWGVWALGGVLDVMAVGPRSAVVLYAYPAAYVVLGLAVIGVGWLGGRRGTAGGRRLAGLEERTAIGRDPAGEEGGDGGMRDTAEGTSTDDAPEGSGSHVRRLLLSGARAAGSSPYLAAIHLLNATELPDADGFAAFIGVARTRRGTEVAWVDDWAGLLESELARGAQDGARRLIEIAASLAAGRYIDLGECMACLELRDARTLIKAVVIGTGMHGYFEIVDTPALDCVLEFEGELVAR